MNREQWLLTMTQELSPVFEHGDKRLDLGMIRMSCGLPPTAAFSKRKRAIGCCFASECSEDGVSEIFISPTIADPVEVGGTIVHEVCHHLVGTKHGHRAPFKRFAALCGLEGPATSTEPGGELTARIQSIVNRIGPYPHRILTGMEKEKKQSTRMKKLACPNCEYTCRTTKKWIEVGLPICPCGRCFDLIEEGGEDD